MPDMADPTVHNESPAHRERALVFEVVYHYILIVQVAGLLLVLGMHVLVDASSALGKKVASSCRNIEFLVFVRRGNLDVGVCLYVDVVQRVVLCGKTCSDLVVDLFLTRNLFIYLSLLYLC
jgi:hypothetical protein